MLCYPSTGMRIDNSAANSPMGFTHAVLRYISTNKWWVVVFIP